jgi:hypothetical protein
MVTDQGTAYTLSPPKIYSRLDGSWTEVYTRSVAGCKSAHTAGGGQFPEGAFWTFLLAAKFPLGKLGTKVYQKMRTDLLHLFSPIPRGVTLLRLKVIHEKPEKFPRNV